MLRAKQRITVGNYTYRPGDYLPDTDDKEAWLESGVAFEETEPEEEKPKAKSLTARKGLPGKASNHSDGEDLIGRLPARRKKK